MLVLIVEGRVEIDAEAQLALDASAVAGASSPSAACSLGLSTFQAEFDFGVPQFNLVLEPVMLAFAAGVALVAARLWAGPAPRSAPPSSSSSIRGGLALIVGPGFGETVPHFPLYLAEARCVELLALAVPTLLAARPYAFGAAAGALIGTVGFLAEYAWSHVWMPVPWPEALLGDAIVPVLITGDRRRDRRCLPRRCPQCRRGARRGRANRRRRRRRWRRPLPGLAAIARRRRAQRLPTRAVGLNGEVTLTEVTPAPERSADATVRIEPRRRPRRRELGQRDRLAGRREAPPRSPRGDLARRL